MSPKTKLIGGLAVMTLAAAVASAVPIPNTNCTANPSGGGFTCNVYQTDGQSNPSETSNIFSLPFNVNNFYVILLETPSNSNTDITTWSDVLQFTTVPGTVPINHLQYFSDGCNCFSSIVSAINGGAGAATILETPTGTGGDFTDFTQFTITFNNNPGETINAFSGSPAVENDAPEPATLGIVTLGLAGLWAARKRLRRAVR